MTNNFLETALSFLSNGLTPIPVSGKKPCYRWGDDVRRKVGEDQVREWFTNHDSHTNPGIALICGTPSGGLEILDFDNKYGDARQRFGQFAKELARIWENSSWGKLPPFVAQSTPSGGFHLVYRIRAEEGELDGNLKLATRKKIANIETRGEGGIFVVAPTEGYKVIRNDLCNPPVLELHQRDVLIQLARSFTEDAKPGYKPRPLDRTRPGDIYNALPDIRERAQSVLEDHGWTFQYERGGIRMFCRPGKDAGVSASLDVNGTLFVFTTSVPEFNNDTFYHPFAQYCMLNGLEFDEGAQRLIDTGVIQTEELPSRAPSTERGMPKKFPRFSASVPSFESMITAAQLVENDYEPVTWCVQDMMAQGGHTLLVGGPKRGKSFLALNIAMGVANGQTILGNKGRTCSEGEVLMISLDDRNESRLAGRIKGMRSYARASGHNLATPNFRAVFEWASLAHDQAINWLDAYIGQHPNTRLVIIDVLASLTEDKQSGSVYKREYDTLRKLSGWSNSTGVSVLTLHHTSKKDYGFVWGMDPLEIIGGSNGIAGAVDDVLVLTKYVHPPQSKDFEVEMKQALGMDARAATLHVRGRNVAEGELSIAFYPRMLTWLEHNQVVYNVVKAQNSRGIL